MFAAFIWIQNVREKAVKALEILKSYLKTDSTKTRSAFTWTMAQKHSLKFTFNHLTSGP